MKPIKLILENVHSFRGVHEIDFTDVTLAALIGPNGGGKSTVAHDAPLFALYGETRGALDSIITETEQACRVEFVFALGEDTYLVSRQRSRKGAGSTLLSFQMLTPDGPVVLDGNSVAETQARIESVLHMDADLLRVTAFSSQGQSGTFSRAKPAARKQVLSDILDLVAWERRADVARQVGRDVAAQLEADRTRHAALRATASEADALREQIAQTEATQGDVTRQVAATEAELAQTQGAKEALVRDREADRAQRQSLEELTSQAQRTKMAIGETTTRLSQLEKAVSGKAALLDGIRRAEEGQTYSQELEAKRQEDERLQHEAELLEQRKRAATTEHQQAIRTLKERIEQARASHDRQVRSLRQRVSDLNAQAEPLERVPCADSEMAATCPLIAAALKAKAALPGVEAELSKLLENDPAADDAKRLVALESQPVAQTEEKRLREIATARKEAGYNSAEHAKAKQAAGKLRDLQESLHRVERAEAQLTEVRSQLGGLTAEAKQTAERRAALEKELGPARDWDALLAQAEQTMKTARAAIANLQARLQTLGQQRGTLEERLRLAEHAVAEVEQLSVQVRDGERRLNLLKILAQAFGKSGIPALLIEQAVPDLEAVANDVLSMLSDGRMSLALRSQRETKAKTIQETLDIVIADEHGERAYENFSGGETMRVDLALRIGLSMLLASRAGARCEMLVLDETCAPLDAQGRALFVDCLGRISDRFATVLVVTHVDELKELFPYRFEVSKNGQGSMVQLVAA
jgi:exonuclease SbcC